MRKRECENERPHRNTVRNDGIKPCVLLPTHSLVLESEGEVFSPSQVQKSTLAAPIHLQCPCDSHLDTFTVKRAKVIGFFWRHIRNKKLDLHVVNKDRRGIHRSRRNVFGYGLGRKQLISLRRQWDKERISCPESRSHIMRKTAFSMWDAVQSGRMEDVPVPQKQVGNVIWRARFIDVNGLLLRSNLSGWNTWKPESGGCNPSHGSRRWHMR